MARSNSEDYSDSEEAQPGSGDHELRSVEDYSNSPGRGPVFVDEQGNPRLFCIKNLKVPGRSKEYAVSMRRKLKDLVKQHGGALIKDPLKADRDVTVIIPQEIKKETRQLAYSAYKIIRHDIWVEHATFIRECIGTGIFQHDVPPKRGGQLGRRNSWNEEDDRSLAWFISRHPDRGRSFGEKVYEKLFEGARDLTNPPSFVLRHTAQSSRERYRKNRVKFDPIIDAFQEEFPPKRKRESNTEEDDGNGEDGEYMIEQAENDSVRRPKKRRTAYTDSGSFRGTAVGAKSKGKTKAQPEDDIPEDEGQGSSEYQEFDPEPGPSGTQHASIPPPTYFSQVIINIPDPEPAPPPNRRRTMPTRGARRGRPLANVERSLRKSSEPTVPQGPTPDTPPGEIIELEEDEETPISTVNTTPSPPPSPPLPSFQEVISTPVLAFPRRRAALGHPGNANDAPYRNTRAHPQSVERDTQQHPTRTETGVVHLDTPVDDEEEVQEVSQHLQQDMDSSEPALVVVAETYEDERNVEDILVQDVSAGSAGSSVSHMEGGEEEEVEGVLQPDEDTGSGVTIGPQQHANPQSEPESRKKDRATDEEGGLTSDDEETNYVLTQPQPPSPPFSRGSSVEEDDHAKDILRRFHTTMSVNGSRAFRRSYLAGGSEKSASRAPVPSASAGIQNRSALDLVYGPQDDDQAQSISQGLRQKRPPKQDALSQPRARERSASSIDSFPLSGTRASQAKRVLEEQERDSPYRPPSGTRAARVAPE
ncbi:hypothetical protein AX16_008933 [Volvariella volvacea WC 439]|nr:hypothetical protein AX16_008933 [Volvariella volvacea WC 439]